MRIPRFRDVRQLGYDGLKTDGELSRRAQPRNGATGLGCSAAIVSTTGYGAGSGSRARRALAPVLVRSYTSSSKSTCISTPFLASRLVLLHISSKSTCISTSFLASRPVSVHHFCQKYVGHRAHSRRRCRQRVAQSAESACKSPLLRSRREQCGHPPGCTIFLVGATLGCLVMPVCFRVPDLCFYVC